LILEEESMICSLLQPIRSSFCLAVVLLLGLLKPTFPAAERPLTLAEMDTLEITMPIARLTGSGPTENGHTPYLTLWVSDDGETWEEVFGSSGYGGHYAAVPGPPQPRRYHALLEKFPRFLRAGSTGYYTGPVYVDGVEIIAPDGTIFAPIRAEAVNRASDVEHALAVDGQPATISHSVGETAEETHQVDAVQLEFEYPADVAHRFKPLARPTVELPPLRWGVYTTTGGDSDPYHVPPGWVYQTDPAALAKYDFSLLQNNNPEVVRRVKDLNPDHRVLLRGWPGGQFVLDYCYDEAAREQCVRNLLRMIEPTADLIHGLTIGEEELANMYAGWYGSEPPDWLLKYRDRYEEETGNEFQFRSGPLQTWLAEKARFVHNDLYDRVKAVYPNVKVMPFLYLPGDPSGWAWIPPAELKADGWVYQWFNADTRDILKPCRHTLPEITEVGVRERWFNNALHQLRAAGIPMDEVYVQIWVYREDDDYRPQLEGVRAAGVGHVFCFYYCGWIPPEPPAIVNPNDLSFRAVGPEGTPLAGAAHERHDQFLPVDQGRAQSFVASGNRLTQVAFYLSPTDHLPAHTITLEKNGRRIPDGRPLASAELAPEAVAEEGWVEVPLSADLEPGETYWLTLRPKDRDASPLLLGATTNNAYAGGEAVHYETHGTYFRNWRTWDLTQMGIGHWPASYRQRVAIEGLIE